MIDVRAGVGAGLGIPKVHGENACLAGPQARILEVELGEEASKWAPAHRADGLFVKGVVEAAGGAGGAQHVAAC